MNVLHKALFSSAQRAGHWSLVSPRVTWCGKVLVASWLWQRAGELWQGSCGEELSWLAKWLSLLRCRDSTVDCLFLELPLEAPVYQ